MSSVTGHPLRPSWQQRGVGNMTANVVQSVFNREMGYPYFSKSSEIMSNGRNEKMIGRHLINRRVSTPSKTACFSKELILGKKEVKSAESDDICSDCKGPVGWFKIKVENHSKINYIAGLFWKSTYLSRIQSPSLSNGLGNDRRVKTYSNGFYRLELGSRKRFKELGSYTSNGVLTDFEVITSRALETSRHHGTFIVMLTEIGYLYAVNLSSLKQIKNPEVMLLESPPECRFVRFTDMCVDYEEQLIHCVSSSKGYTKSITLISLPPRLSAKMILHILIPHYKLQTWGSVAATHNCTTLELLSFCTLIELAEDANDKCRVSTPSMPSAQPIEKTLRTKPQGMVTFSTMNGYFGLLESTWPPLCYTKTPNGLNVRPLFDKEPIWSSRYDSYTNVSFEPMPDASNGAYFTKDDEQSLITWTKKTDNPPAFVATKHTPFQTSELPTQATHEPPTRFQRQRVCKSSRKYNDRSTKVLGLEYFEGLDLLAVCAMSFGNLIVTLYEPKSFKVFKRLAPVKFDGMRQSRRSTSSDSEEENPIDRISGVSVRLDYEVVLVFIQYDSKSEIFGNHFLEDDVFEIV